MNPDETAHEAFLRTFKGYKVPDELKVSHLPEHEKKGYYLHAKDLVENPVFKAEFQEWKRRIFYELAMNTTTELERQGYRMTLLAIQEFEDKLRGYAGMHQGGKSLVKVKDML